MKQSQFEPELESKSGTIYVVSTPIGNLEDMSFRAVSVLNEVDIIAAEDTRHSKGLLAHYAINTPCVSYHQHNEAEVAVKLLFAVEQGQTIALISDAGTPLINDPGYQLISKAIDSNIRVIPIPGCCALISALSVSGLPTSQFSFYGYPPRTQAARQNFFTGLLRQSGTLLFYESSHRIKDCLKDVSTIFPASRKLVIARELTKKFESIQSFSVCDIEKHFANNDYAAKGEFVVLIDGHEEGSCCDAELNVAEQILTVLLQECSLKTAVELAVKLTGNRKKTIYQLALKLQNNQ